MPNRDRMYCQTIRTVKDISCDDRAIIATCSLRTLTDRLKENYSIDISVHTIHTVTSVFSFTMFTATTVLCDSIKNCLELEISRNNYPGIFKIHQRKISNFPP